MTEITKDSVLLALQMLTEDKQPHKYVLVGTESQIKIWKEHFGQSVEYILGDRIK